MKKLLLLLTLSIFAVGCTEKIPAGYKGKRLTSSGMDKELLLPGNHTCWGRDVLYTISEATHVVTERLNILTKDRINITLDLKVRATPLLNSKNFNIIMNDLSNKFVLINGDDLYSLESAWIYNAYITPALRPITRSIINKYPINEVAENRDKIGAEITEAIKVEMNDLPIAINLAKVSNIDFPKIITAAKEGAMERRELIQKEKAQMAVELLKLENRQKLAEKEKIVRMKEAEAERIYNQIVGKGLTANYLKLREIENNAILYKRVGAGDKVLFNATNGAYFLGK